MAMMVAARRDGGPVLVSPLMACDDLGNSRCFPQGMTNMLARSLLFTVSVMAVAITSRLTVWGFRSKKTARTPSAITRTAASRQAKCVHFLAAHCVVGQPEKADRVLRAMLQRQAEGKFPNGVRDAGGQGIDWTDWSGNLPAMKAIWPTVTVSFRRSCCVSHPSAPAITVRSASGQRALIWIKPA